MGSRVFSPRRSYQFTVSNTALDILSPTLSSRGRLHVGKKKLSWIQKSEVINSYTNSNPGGGNNVIWLDLQ